MINSAAETPSRSSSSGGDFWFGILVAGGLAYGGYEIFFERYMIEQEYAFMSVCVGEQGSLQRKERCVDKLKQCLKDDKKFK